MLRILISWIIIVFSQNVFAQLSAKSGELHDLVATDGAWCWFADPRAVYHKGIYEKSYFGYINSKGDVVISARDEKTKEVKSFVLHPKLQIDDHNVPSILFLPDHRLLVFYTHHNGTFFMRKSKNPEDITAWEDEQTFDFGMEKRRICYSHPAMLAKENNRIYMVFRSSPLKPKSWEEYGQYLSYSDDLGKTWNKAQYLFNLKGINNPMYLKLSTDNKSRIDFLFTDGHPKIGAASVYHMYYEKGAFRQTNGEKIANIQDAPLMLDKINKVYDVNNTGIKAWIWDIALDKKNRPAVAYSQYPSIHDHMYHYAQWNGKKWLDYELLNSGGYITSPEKSGKVLEEHYSGGIVLDHTRPENVYLSRKAGKFFEIEHWLIRGTKWIAQKITENSTSDNLRPYVLAHYPGKRPPVFWMSGRYEHYTRFFTDIRVSK